MDDYLVMMKITLICDDDDADADADADDDYGDADFFPHRGLRETLLPLPV